MKASALRKQAQEFRTKMDVQFAESASTAVLDGVTTEPNAKRYDELAAYMAPFRKYPTLTKPEDYTFLFEKFANGNETERLRARDLLVYGNVKLVLRAALRYTGRGLPLVDLLQEGVIGLMRAIEKYGIERGFRFSTYAYHWIKQGITRALFDRNERDPYRMPVHFQENLSSIRRAMSELYLKNGRWPTNLQVYEWAKSSGSQNASKLSLADIAKMRRVIESGKDPTTRLDAPAFGNEDSDDTVGDVLYVGPPKTETIVEARRLYEEYSKAVARIETAVDELPPRSAMVIRLRYGLGDFEAMTLDEIGQRYEVTRERIRQIEAEALERVSARLGISSAEIAEIIDVVQDLEVIANAI